MNAMMICLVAATFGGTDVGWKQLEDGGTEYIIQLDPQTIEAMKDGSDFQSPLHPGAGNDVRSFRVVMNKGPLQRDTPPAKRTTARKATQESNVSPKLEPPGKLLPNPSQKPMPGQPAVFEEPENKPSPIAKAAPAEPVEPSQPWLLMTLALFASIGANVYLGWVAWESRRRCKTANAGLLAKEP